MTEVIIKDTIEGSPWKHMSDLFFKVGWGGRAPTDIQAAFLKSSYVRFAYHGDTLVGFGRTVDDGIYYALVVDLVIDPEYQGSGIGSRILAELKDDLKGFLFTTLTAAPGKDGFYLKQGWCRQKTSFIWPRTNNQRDNHAANVEQDGQPDA
jgi:GNAT superfamily N-acetyltransferase